MCSTADLREEASTQTNGSTYPKSQSTDDFFKTEQDVKAIPQSKWQLLSRFVTETGLPLKQPTHTQGARAKAIFTSLSRVIPHEDPFGLNFVDLGETEDDQSSQDHANEDLPPLLPWREHHRFSDPARRSACPPNPTQRLFETAYAVLDEADAIADYEIQALANEI
jgi:hypothetical protein